MSSFWAPYPSIDADLDRVAEVIRDSIETNHTLIRDALQDLLGRPGKMLRPGLVLLSARFGRNRDRASLPDKIYRIAAAVEMLHTATLVHDDVLDDAGSRRGKPSVNALYGTRTAVLLGDFLFSTCFKIVADEASAENARYLAAGIGHICSGEILQAEDRDLGDVSLRRYRRRIAGKTALLFTLSLHIGARESGLPRRRAYRLARVGHALGMAFQIIDDILDYSSQEKDLGKPAGYDLSNGVYTLPLIAAVKQAEAGGSNGRTGDLRTLVETGEAPLPEIIAAIDAVGGFDAARREAALYTERATRDTSLLPECEARAVLLDVIRRLLIRRS